MNPSQPKNPFATRYWSPGRLPLWLPPGISLDHLAQKLRRCVLGAAIVGPHGSGKTTLLLHLLRFVQRNQRAEVLVRLQSSVKLWRAWQVRWAGRVWWWVDGWPQAPRRRRVVWVAGTVVGRPLVLTLHRPPRLLLPVLWHTQSSPELLAQVVQHLCRRQGVPMPELPWAQLLRRHRGNLREALFELYDLFERQKELPLLPHRQNNQDSFSLG